MRRTVVRVKIARLIAWVAVASGGLLAAACTGDGGGTGSVPGTGGGPGTGPSVLTPFEQVIDGDVGAYGFSDHDFTAPRSGKLTVTLTWANPAINLDLYLTPATCDVYPVYPGNTNCSAGEGVASDGPATPESISSNISNGAGVTFWVDNWSQTLATSYQLRVRIE